MPPPRSLLGLTADRRARVQVDLCCCFRSQGAAICPVRCPRARCAVAAVPGRCFHHGALPWRVGVRTHGAASWPPLACSSSRCRWLPQQQFSSKRQAQNPRTLAHPFVILLELREKEKPRGLFCFTSDWHLTGCLPGRQAAPAFSGNAVNVYTGTGRAQPLEPCWKLRPWFWG